jgi:hypothetical protein
VTTKAWLEGHHFDLEDLAQLLATGDVRVVHDADASDDNAYYLTAPEIDNPPKGTTFYDVAQRLLSHINGLGRVYKADFRPVQLTGRYDTPTRQHIVVAPAAFEARFRLQADGVVTGPDGQPKPNPPSPWPNRFALAATHPDVGEVLDIMGSSEPLGWGELYKVHEIIRDAIKRKKIAELGWASNADDSAFTASANRADVSGSGARHARNSGSTPTRTMTLAEGRSYISDLVTKLLDSLANP